LAGGAAPQVHLHPVCLDDEIRVSHLEDGTSFVYQRVEGLRENTPRH